MNRQRTTPLPSDAPTSEAVPRERETESVRWRDSLALVQQVGRTSPKTRLISVCDREGDIWEMFELQAQDPQAARPSGPLSSMVPFMI